MADDNQHRRVEPRGAVVGTGMLTDPERIQSLEADKARKERAWRAPPKQGFGEVLGHAPKKRFERVGVYTPSDERLAEASQAGAPQAGADEEPTGQATGEAGEEAEGERPGPRSALPPDPRMAALQRALDAKLADKKRPA